MIQVDPSHRLDTCAVCEVAQRMNSALDGARIPPAEPAAAIMAE
jgi:hypothetical protein